MERIIAVDPSEIKQIAEFLDDGFFSDPSISDERKNLIVELVVMKLRQLGEHG